MEDTPESNSMKIEVDEQSGRVHRIHGVALPPNSLSMVTPVAGLLEDRIFSDQEIQTIEEAFAWGKRTRSKD